MRLFQGIRGIRCLGGVLGSCCALLLAVGCPGTSPGGGGASDAPTQSNGAATNDNSDGSGSSDSSPQPLDDDMLDGTENAEYLGSLALGSTTVGGREFLTWVADEFATQQRGLMFVTQAEMADLADGRSRAMLFVFDNDMIGGFWMKDTIIPLDIAFIQADGRIVTIHAMAPLDESSYRPTSSYRFALEVNAGTFATLGIKEGDHVALP